MPREQISIGRQIMILIDLSLVAAAFFLGHILGEKIRHLYPLKDYLGVLPILLSIWGVFLLNYFGSYCLFRADKIPEILLMVFKIAILAFVAFASVVYLFNLTQISRTLTGMVFLVSALLIGLEKIG